MKHLYQSLKGYVAILICFLSVSAVAQLNVNSAASAEDLANAILGSGVSVSNVTLHCGPGGSGIFSNGGSTNVGLNDGILLTSGRAADAIGPNNDGSLTFEQPNAYNGDSELDNLVSGSIEDVCRLEFDFVAESEFISVQYVFGSEEYNEYVCSQFNDVFGFFVSGANPGGGNYNNFNVALVPSTNLPVSVNTINNGSAGNQGSPANCVSLAHSALYTSNAGGLSIQYDGFTVVLTAEIAIVPGETYHFKFAIADVSDSRLDSGVFIRSQSFSVFTCAAGSIFNESTAPADFCLK
ncbi:MAG: choice-of-anchor L domain-containing protein [Flavobacteriales bacterium]|nr:choice-of-anchor L domain-containing protein [Flavobacteriales bacterium]